MSGSKEEIESADVWTCMGDCIPSPASGCGIVQVVSSTIQKTQQRSMSTLERCPQWWVAKWIPQAAEQQLEASLKDKPQCGSSQEVADIRKTYQRLRKAERQHRGTDHGSTGAIEARICRSRQEPYRSNPFSSHLITRLSFVMGSSRRLQMHKVPFAAKFSISFSTSRQHLVPPTCLTSTQDQCFQTSHGWGHPLLKHASARSGVVAQNFQLSSHPGSINWVLLDQYIYWGNFFHCLEENTDSYFSSACFSFSTYTQSNFALFLWETTPFFFLWYEISWKFKLFVIDPVSSVYFSVF